LLNKNTNNKTLKRFVEKKGKSHDGQNPLQVCALLNPCSVFSLSCFVLLSLGFVLLRLHDHGCAFYPLWSKAISCTSAYQKKEIKHHANVVLWTK
jgi:Ni,Fe-hydrogenase I cytochrome b subunit